MSQAKYLENEISPVENISKKINPWPKYLPFQITEKINFYSV